LFFSGARVSVDYNCHCGRAPLKNKIEWGKRVVLKPDSSLFGVNVTDEP
jgi:hypothetical protein